MDFTPLIDVVFQLMIFFMLTSSFVFQTGVEVHLPKAVTSEVSQGMNWQVTVSKEGRLYLETRVVTLQELKRTLNRHRERPVLLRADQRATLGRVIEVWDLCRSLGISQIHIATQDEP
jgi:biopolymer transport protein ExbD